MGRTFRTVSLLGLVSMGIMLAAARPACCDEVPAGPDDGRSALLETLDAPLLFAKRHNYQGIHIYDTYYKWGPGGGLYVLENPAAPPEQQVVRALIDATTPETLGAGVYTDPDVSYDGRRVLFCYKPTADGSTSIYEIGVDGRGLRQVSDPTSTCDDYHGAHGGQHDVAPAYMPDGRIVFTTTRPSGLVPCANSGVDILHVMNGDGSDIHSISVNNVNEFDPCVMSDGRILHGRWEYVDKTALTQQSLWTIFPDGSNETALFANNMVHPEAVLDARPVPDAEHWIVGTFAPHNAPPRGTIAFVNTRAGKNSARAIVNLDTPDDPTHDHGESCDPWPLSRDVVVYSGRPQGAKYNAIMIVNRAGDRAVVQTDGAIDLHSPIPIKPRSRPPVVASGIQDELTTGRFLLQDIYVGMDGVQPGEIKWLRVVEETSRVSPTPGGAYNQVFLLSAALAFSVKNYLGVAPVDEDGSAYFEVPAGKAIYLQALDAEGRMVRSMRTFVQAAPGVTRSCIGCHEEKYSTPQPGAPPTAFLRSPDRPVPESWGSGFVDYPSMVQPVFDRHCVDCHGGSKGIQAGLDLSGGWTEHFSISYENLVNRRSSQLTASLIAGIDCMNGTAYWSAQIFPPRAHGSGAAPLAEVLVSGHEDRIPNLTRTERDLVMAWIDTNGLFHGTWDYTEQGCAVKSWGATVQGVTNLMRQSGCMECHPGPESDWINLQQPELSRVLRGPMAEREGELGLGRCRDRKVNPADQRIRMLVSGGYQHAVIPLEQFPRREFPRPNTDGEPVITFASTADPAYLAMLDVIRQGRSEALAAPRVDMPGAVVLPGECRQFVPTPLPEMLPLVQVTVDDESGVRLWWERSAETIGLTTEIHCGPQPDFRLSNETLLVATGLFEFTHAEAQPGPVHYAVVFSSGDQRSEPLRLSVDVPLPSAPAAPSGLEATAASGRVQLRWDDDPALRRRHHVYRADVASDQFVRLTEEPTTAFSYSDAPPESGVEYAYTVRALNRFNLEGPASDRATAAALPEIREAVFAVPFAENLAASLHGGGTTSGTAHGSAQITDGKLDVAGGGHVGFEHRAEFDLTHSLSMECWVKMTEQRQMPVVVGCGHWNSAGWFLQRIGGGWRWHVGGIDCDGGKPAPGEWTHLLGTFDGSMTRLYQDGALVAEQSGAPILTPFPGALLIGQYSGGPAEPYQVAGQIGPVKIYNRALSADDAKTAFEQKP